MAEGKIDYVFKVVLFGDNGVGKTSIALRFVDNTFEQSPFTIESFKLKTLEIGTLHSYIAPLISGEEP